MHKRLWKNKISILALTALLWCPGIVAAADVALSSPISVESSLLVGDEIFIDLNMNNPERKTLTSYTVSVVYDPTVFSIEEVTYDEEFFDITLPPQETEGRIVLEAGTSMTALQAENIPIGTVHMLVRSIEPGTTEVRLEEGSKIFEITQDGPHNLREQTVASIRHFRLGDFVPPAGEGETSPSGETSSGGLVIASGQESAEIEVLHGAAEEEKEMEATFTHSGGELAAPRGLGYETTPSSARLQWQEVPMAQGYYVYWSTDGVHFLHRKQTLRTQVTFDELQRGQEMTFVVSAIDGQGQEGKRTAFLPVTVGTTPEVTTELPDIEFIPVGTQQQEKKLYSSAPELPSTGKEESLIIILFIGIGFWLLMIAARKIQHMVY